MGQTDEYDIYINNNAFPLVFFVNSQITDMLDYKKYNNPFELQTNIINKISGKNYELFKKADFILEKRENLEISETRDGKIRYKKIDNSKEAYIEYIVKSKKEKNIMYLFIDNLEKIVSKIYLKINDVDVSGDIIDQGDKIIKVDNNDKIKIIIDAENLEMNKDKLYELDREQFENAVKEIKNTKNQYLIEKMKDGYIKINADVNEEKILMTTIPYEKGWKIKINGKQGKIEKLMGVFIGLKTEKGKQVIELKYETPGLKTGIFISLMTIIILIFIKIYKYKNQKLKEMNYHEKL